MSEEIYKNNFDELNEIISSIARNRALEYVLPAEEILKLADLVDHISENGTIPRWLGKAPKENDKDDVVMYLKGQTSETAEYESSAAYIQWGNQTNLKCTHLGFLGIDFTIIKNSEAVFNHEMRRNLDESEIRDVSNVLKRSSWQSVEYKSIAEIIAEEKANDLSSES